MKTTIVNRKHLFPSEHRSKAVYVMHCTGFGWEMHKLSSLFILFLKMRKKIDDKILTEIDEFFKNAKKHPTVATKYIGKARKLAKRNNLSLKKYRKLFCRKCNSFFTSENSQVRIEKGMKSIRCLKCGAYRRFKL